MIENTYEPDLSFDHQTPATRFSNMTPTLSFPYTPPGVEVIDLDDSDESPLAAGEKQLHAGRNSTEMVKFGNEADGSARDSDRMDQALLTVFGLPSFRTKQREVVDLMVQGEDLLYIFPTGMGKSLCFQLAAYLRDDLTIVVSPLIALMGDQMSYLQSLPGFGTVCECLHSSMTLRDQNRICAKLRSLKLLYMSPETLKKMVHRLPKVGLLVVDEAHCISEWGHDFRPSYLLIGELRMALGKPPCAACTATATLRVQENIIESLDFAANVRLVELPFDRPNLHYCVRSEHSGKFDEIMEECTKGAGILYCFRKADCEDMARTLRQFHIKAKAYHAGLRPREKTRVAAEWKEDQLDVVCCTIAFGMGVDKQNVRFVIHVDPPKSIENYAQETGRAGRDGKPSHCIMYYGGARQGPFAVDERAAKKLEEVAEFATTEECRRKHLLGFFGQKMEKVIKPCCDACDGMVTDRTMSEPSVAGTTHKKGMVTGFRPATCLEQVPRCGSRKVFDATEVVAPFSSVTQGDRSPRPAPRRSRRLLKLACNSEEFVPRKRSRPSPEARTPSNSSSPIVIAPSPQRRKTRPLIDLSLCNPKLKPAEPSRVHMKVDSPCLSPVTAIYPNPNSHPNPNLPQRPETRALLSVLPLEKPVAPRVELAVDSAEPASASKSRSPNKASTVRKYPTRISPDKRIVRPLLDLSAVHPTQAYTGKRQCADMTQSTQSTVATFLRSISNSSLDRLHPSGNTSVKPLLLPQANLRRQSRLNAQTLLPFRPVKR